MRRLKVLLTVVALVVGVAAPFTPHKALADIGGCRACTNRALDSTPDGGLSWQFVWPS